MYRDLKKHVQNFIRDKPGRRFRGQYKKKKVASPEHPVQYAILLVSGVLLSAFGITVVLLTFGSTVGFLILFIGLVMLGSRSKVAAVFLDRVEVRFLQLYARAYRRLQRKVQTLGRKK